MFMSDHVAGVIDEKKLKLSDVMLSKNFLYLSCFIKDFVYNDNFITLKSPGEHP